MKHGLVVLLLVINAIVASSYPYSHLARVRERRIPNPRQVYRNQNMLLRGERGRKAVPEHPSERLRNAPYSDQRPALAPTRTRSHAPYNQPNQPLSDQQQSGLLFANPRLESEQTLTYLGNRPLLQRSGKAETENEALPSDQTPHLGRNGLTRQDSEQVASNPDENVPSVASNQGGSLSSPEKENNGNDGDSETVVRPPLKQTYSQSNPTFGRESQQFPYGNNLPVEQPNRGLFRNQQLPYQQPSDQQLPYQQPSNQQSPYQQQSDHQLPYQQPSDRQLPYQQPSDEQTSDQQSSDQQPSDQQTSDQQLPYQQPSDQQLPYQQPSAQQLPYQQPSIQQLPFPRGGPANGQQLSYLNSRPLPLPPYNPPSPYFNGRQPVPFQQPGYFNNGPLLPGNRQPFPPRGPPYRSEDQLPFRGTGPSSDHVPLYGREENNHQPSHDRREVNPEIISAKSRLGHHEPADTRSEGGAEEPCDESNCPELENCLNSTKEGCCPVCETHACKCQGYQFYDCVSNGFKDGLVPEGESYSVDMGSTICSCPVGGGVIMCSFQDHFEGGTDDSSPVKPRLLCAPPPVNCIETYKKSDGCVECIGVGCVGEDGAKYRAGERVSQERCSTCTCPAEGGMIVCQIDASCDEANERETIDEPSQTSLALKATQRVMRDPLSVEESKGLYDRDNIEQGYDTRFLQPDWNNLGTDKAAVPRVPDAPSGTHAAESGAENTNIGGIVSPPLVDPNQVNSINGKQIPPGPFYQGGYRPYNQGNYHGGYNDQYPYSYNYNGGYDNQGQHYNEEISNRRSNDPQGSQGNPNNPQSQERSSEGQGEGSEGDSRETNPQDSGLSRNPENGETAHSDREDSTSNLQPFVNYGGQHPGYGGLNYGNNNNFNPGPNPQPLPSPKTENNQQPQPGYPSNVGGFPYLPNGQALNNIPNNLNSYNGQPFPYLPGYPNVNPGFPPYVYPQRDPRLQVPYGGEIPFPHGDANNERQQYNLTDEASAPLHPTSVTQQLLYELNNHSIENNQSTSFENVVSACCHEGQKWGSSHQSCVNIPINVNSYSQICGVVQEKCCNEFRAQESCKSGITTARSMAACDVTSASAKSCDDGFKTCCDCCALGLKAYSLSIDCSMEILGEPCNSAYKRCCREGRMVPDASVTSSSSAAPSSSPPSPGPSPPERAIPRCATHNNCPHACVDTGDGIRCDCLSGFQLEDDGLTCTDINECVLGTHNCVDGQFCLNLLGSFNCQRLISCGTGYELTDKNTCNDIDECALGLHNCEARLTCVNIRGSFRCVPKLCDEGYFTDATGGCIDIDECRAGDFSCPARAHCVNTVGSYSCQCPDGLVFDKSGHLCQDIDECALGTSQCDAGSTCVNTDGSYTCEAPPALRCDPGFEPNIDSTLCIDVDECTRGTHTCSSGSTCINEEGSFRCQDPIQCETGTRLSPNRRSCTDIDECREGGPSLCGEGGACINTYGSYRCECAVGFKPSNLTETGTRCEDIDECALPGGYNCMYQCQNNPGSYTCICPEGYTISGFGQTCEDVDECQLSRDSCSTSQTCFNTRGSHKCVELECPERYVKLSNRRCVRQHCRKAKDKRACIKLPKQISFHNITVVSNAPKDKALFRMSLARGFPTDRYYFFIREGNEDRSFRVAKKRLKKRQTGIIYTTRRLTGPRDYVIDLTLKLYRRHRWATFISRVYLYVSEFTF